MAKAILISLHSKAAVSVIYSVRQKLDMRFKPSTYPIDVYVYCTKHGNETCRMNVMGKMRTIPLTHEVFGESINGKVIGKCRLVDVEDLPNGMHRWHLIEQERFKRLRHLLEFGIRRAPQSWQYINEK